MSKYRARRTNGYASKKESKWAADLALLARCGEISELQEQVKYELLPKQGGERAVHYVADFVYRSKDGQLHVVDAKGFRTREYILKRKLMKFRHGITIEEV